LKLRIAMRNPGHRAWTKEEIELIGTMPDHDLARKLGRHPSTVVSKRLAMKIPYRRPRYKWWKPEELKLLGQMPDAEVARRTGRPLKGVMLKRLKLGMPSPFDRRKIRK
jgi:hypothetical protein